MHGNFRMFCDLCKQNNSVWICPTMNSINAKIAKSPNPRTRIFHCLNSGNPHSHPQIHVLTVSEFFQFWLDFQFPQVNKCTSITRENLWKNWEHPLNQSQLFNNVWSVWFIFHRNLNILPVFWIYLNVLW